MAALRCPVCPRRLSEAKLGEHLTERHTGTLHAFRCGLCRKEFAYAASMVTHLLQARHSPHSLRQVDRTAELRRLVAGALGLAHEEAPADEPTAADQGHWDFSHQLPTELRCPSCPKKLTWNRLGAHMVERHLGSLHRFFCDECGERFPDSVALVSHTVSSGHAPRAMRQEDNSAELASLVAETLRMASQVEPEEDDDKVSQIHSQSEKTEVSRFNESRASQGTELSSQREGSSRQQDPDQGQVADLSYTSEMVGSRSGSQASQEELGSEHGHLDSENEEVLGSELDSFLEDDADEEAEEDWYYDTDKKTGELSSAEPGRHEEPVEEPRVREMRDEEHKPAFQSFNSEPSDISIPDAEGSAPSMNPTLQSPDIDDSTRMKNSETEEADATGEESFEVDEEAMAILSDIEEGTDDHDFGEADSRSFFIDRFESSNIELDTEIKKPGRRRKAPKPEKLAPGAILPARHQRAILWDEFRKHWLKEVQETGRGETLSDAQDHLTPFQRWAAKSRQKRIWLIKPTELAGQVAALIGMNRERVMEWFLYQRKALAGDGLASRGPPKVCPECQAQIVGHLPLKFHREMEHGLVMGLAPWRVDRVSEARGRLAAKTGNYCPEWEDAKAARKRKVRHPPGLTRVTRTAEQKAHLWELLRRLVAEADLPWEHELRLQRQTAEESGLTPQDVSRWLCNRRRELNGLGQADTPTFACDCGASVKGSKAFAFHRQEICGLGG